ncbi:HTH domain-containing protein [Ligilactobacillus ruminis]|uniref:HTH domain-containing protein n=1 Tax=Ligilactobacillus ruminis TaxID=1623 RepID=A0AAQ2XJE9_9LACO|nr:HTH domain-containing protein [Ligilactobacillus ruminis]WDC81275.1 HTH domain-containing protein [Ligilactobacillus ruminis]
METIEKVFNLLTETPEYVSGQQIANKLNISRTAVWKAVSSLKQRGFLIEGKTRMGYRDLPSMKLNEDGIRRYLDSALDLTFETYEQIESTNDFCKNWLSIKKYQNRTLFCQNIKQAVTAAMDKTSFLQKSAEST